MIRRKPDVKFVWLDPASFDEDIVCELMGNVITRSGDGGCAEMVIDICEDDTIPYLIVGRRPDGTDYYQGTNEARDAMPIFAKWTRSGRLCSGTWLEDGVEWSVQFELPKQPRRTDDRHSRRRRVRRLRTSTGRR